MKHIFENPPLTWIALSKFDSLIGADLVVGLKQSMIAKEIISAFTADTAQKLGITPMDAARQLGIKIFISQNFHEAEWALFCAQGKFFSTGDSRM